jgi:hypothetical protein
MDSAQLRSLAHRLKAWRATRVGRQRIPEKFWAAAAELAGVHGLNRTAAKRTALLKVLLHIVQHRRLSPLGVHKPI